MSNQSSSRDWSDPFGSGPGSTFDPEGAPKGRGVLWIFVLCVIAAAIAVGVYLFQNPPQFLDAEKTIVVGLPDTTSVVIQIELPATLDGLDEVLKTDTRGVLGSLVELLEQRRGINVPIDQVEYLVAAINQPTWMLNERPQDEWVESMLFYVRFKTSAASSAIIPPGTPQLPTTDGSTVYQIDQVQAMLVDERTWLICPSNLLTAAREAYEQESQPEWIEDIRSSDSMVFAGRISGMPGPDITQEIEVLVSGSFGNPCIVNGHCTTPRMDQARQLVDELERLLDQDFQGRGPIRNSFFDSADLALSGRTVTFEGSIPASEVKLAMAPVIGLIGFMTLASAFEVPEDPPVDEPLPDGIPDQPTDWSILEGEYDRQESAEALDRIIQQYLDEDDHEAALDACTRAIAMHPDDASFELMVIEKRANVYMLIENYEQALSEYELLLVRNLDRDSSGRDLSARAWIGSAQALIALNRTDEALENLQSGHDVFDAEDEVTEDLLAVRIARAQLNRQLGNQEAAIQELEEVIQLSQFDSVNARAQAELDAIRNEQPQN